MEDHDVRAAMLGEPFTMSGLRRLQPSGMRNYRTSAAGSSNEPYRPLAPLEDWSYRRAV